MQNKIQETALHLLARRDHTSLELTQKLRVRGHDQKDIDMTLQQLHAKGFINEARFVENYIESRRKKGIGPERIRAELKARGITDDLIAQHLDITDNAWLNELRRVWQKHFRGKLPQDFKERARQLRFFQYRGFTHEQIMTLLKDMNSNDE